MTGVEIVILGVGIGTWLMGVMCVASIISVGVVASTAIVRAIQAHAAEKYKYYFHSRFSSGTKDSTLEEIYKNLVKCLITHADKAHYIKYLPVEGSYVNTTKDKVVPIAVCILVLTDQPNAWYPSKLRILFNPANNTIDIMTKTRKELDKFTKILESATLNPSTATSKLQFVCSESDIGVMQ
jgi:hypothetical protein